MSIFLDNCIMDEIMFIRRFYHLPININESAGYSEEAFDISLDITRETIDQVKETVNKRCKVVKTYTSDDIDVYVDYICGFNVKITTIFGNGIKGEFDPDSNNTDPYKSYIKRIDGEYKIFPFVNISLEDFHEVNFLTNIRMLLGHEFSHVNSIYKTIMSYKESLDRMFDANKNDAIDLMSIINNLKIKHVDKYFNTNTLFVKNTKKNINNYIKDFFYKTSDVEKKSITTQLASELDSLNIDADNINNRIDEIIKDTETYSWIDDIEDDKDRIVTFFDLFSSDEIEPYVSFYNKASGRNFNSCDQIISYTNKIYDYFIRFFTKSVGNIICDIIDKKRKPMIDGLQYDPSSIDKKILKNRT